METIAFYWEPIIRTYGFQTETGLSLTTLEVSPDRMGDLGRAFAAMGAQKGLFRAVFAQIDDGMRFLVYLLLDRKQVDNAVSHIETELESTDPVSVSTMDPVDLIYFHGPHFGDRYGIADAVFHTLDADAVPVLVSGFSGSVVYLVVPGGSVHAAEQSLAKAFTVPERKHN